MKVRITAVAPVADGRHRYEPGQIVDIDPDLAHGWAGLGYCEPLAVAGPAPAEPAPVKPRRARKPRAGVKAHDRPGA